MSIFFITGAGRSGTTAALRLLQLDGRVEGLLEPSPNLNLESRAAFDGTLTNPHEVIARDILPRVARTLDRGRIYVEKQVSLAPLIPALSELMDCRFILTVRDGRDVVRSLLEWHRSMFPIIYRECRQPETLGHHAAEVEKRIVGDDPFDASLPRPKSSDPAFERWPTMSRLEMCAWYWNHVNRVVLQHLRQLPADRYLIVDLSQNKPAAAQQLLRFVGASEDVADQAVALLSRGVNSVRDRLGADEAPLARQPWTEDQQQRFFDHAIEMMTDLGYVEHGHRPTPAEFGRWWAEDAQVDPAWFASILDYRRQSHDQFLAWGASKIGSRVASIIDIGSGIGELYVEQFRDIDFLGIDMTPEVVDWANAHRGDGTTRFLCTDIIADAPDEQADLVFSHATIDNTYDIDAFLRSACRMSRNLLYIATYRGYHPQLSSHRYTWDPKMAVFFNDLSPARAEQVVRDAGFRSVVIFPFATGREDFPAETVLVASREAASRADLIGPCSVHCAYPPYRVRASSLAADVVLGSINQGCAYFSQPPLQLTNPLIAFADLCGALTRLENLSCLPLGDLLAPSRAGGLGVRVDVDMDLVTALQMAEIAESHGLPLTFFLLHTAGYYGSFADGVFSRHEQVATHYLRLQTLGHEVGLHNDALHAYLNWNVDGAEALRSELQWMRSIGLRVRGTSGHNTAPVYGAENYEIFRGRSGRKLPYATQAYRWYPTDVLDEAELGLAYEAGNPTPAWQGEDPPMEHPFVRSLPRGDFLRDPAWIRTYLHDNPYTRWGYDLHAWLIGPDFWVVSDRRAGMDARFLYRVSQREIVELLSASPRGTRACITLHPIYYGHRTQPGLPPEMPS